MNATQSNPRGPFTEYNPTSDSFDFDVWARAVRRQLVAALQHGVDVPNSQLESYHIDEGNDPDDLDDSEPESED